MNAGPSPLLRFVDQSGANRIHFDVADSSDEMLLVHHKGVKALLPEMSLPFLPLVDVSGVSQMCRAKESTETVDISRYGNDVNMVRHQTVCPDVYSSFVLFLGYEPDISLIIPAGKEGAHPSVAPLSDVVRKSGDDKSGDTSHTTKMADVGGIKRRESEQ